MHTYLYLRFAIAVSIRAYAMMRETIAGCRLKRRFAPEAVLLPLETILMNLAALVLSFGQRY